MWIKCLKLCCKIYFYHAYAKELKKQSQKELKKQSQNVTSHAFTSPHLLIQFHKFLQNLSYFDVTRHLTPEKFQK